MGAGGDDEGPELLPVLIFVDAAGNISAEASSEEILSVVQTAASERNADRQLMRELTAHVKALTAALGMTDRVAQITGYARAWKKDGPDSGWVVDQAGYAELLAAKADVEIFVVEKGEFAKNNPGEVWFHRRRHDLSAQLYRILVHTLRNNGHAGSAIELTRACWLASDAESTETQYQFNDDRKRVNTATYRLGAVLGTAGICKLPSLGTGIYSMQPCPTYYLVELIEPVSQPGR